MRKINSLRDFRKFCPQEYRDASKQGFIELICNEMNWILPKNYKQKPKGYWDVFENCFNEALKHDTIRKWRKSSYTSYRRAVKHGWIGQCTKHMIFIGRHQKGYWTKERCIEDALNYKTLAEWRKNGLSSYKIAVKNNWVIECCKHMKYGGRKKGYEHSKEQCIEIASKYSNLTDFRKQDKKVYYIAKKNGWLVECVKHMKNVNILRGYEHSKEQCIEIASKYSNLTDFRKYETKVYYIAKKNGWLIECVKHMKNIGRIRGIEFTKEQCIEIASKYSNLTDFRKHNKKIYKILKNNGWLIEVKIKLQHID